MKILIYGEGMVGRNLTELFRVSGHDVRNASSPDSYDYNPDFIINAMGRSGGFKYSETKGETLYKDNIESYSSIEKLALERYKSPMINLLSSCMYSPCNEPICVEDSEKYLLEEPHPSVKWIALSKRDIYRNSHKSIQHIVCDTIIGRYMHFMGEKAKFTGGIIHNYFSKKTPIIYNPHVVRGITAISHLKIIIDEAFYRFEKLRHCSSTRRTLSAFVSDIKYISYSKLYITETTNDSYVPYKALKDDEESDVAYENKYYDDLKDSIRYYFQVYGDSI